MSKIETDHTNSELIQDALRLAHDLRAPAMVLRGYLKNKCSADLVQKGIEQLLSLSDHYIAQLRAHTQTQSPDTHRAPEHESVEIKEVRALVKASLKALSSIQSSSIKTSFYNYLSMQQCLEASSDMLVRGHKVLLRSIFDNIIKNAFEACEGLTNPEIRVSLYKDNGDLVIEIQDTGCGMSPSQIKDQLEGRISPRSSKAEGHGVGLRGVLTQLNRWNAKLEINSDIGKGTTCVVRLPPIRSIAIQQLN